jgi:hypothetical protein
VTDRDGQDFNEQVPPADVAAGQEEHPRSFAFAAAPLSVDNRLRGGQGRPSAHAESKSLSSMASRSAATEAS